MFEVRRGNVLSAEMLFHVPPYRPRNKEEFVSNPAADCGKRTPPGVAFQRVPLFLCQNVPLQTICRCVLRFKDYGAPAVKRSLKVRLCAGGKAALEFSVAALFQNAERFGGFVYVGPLPVRIEGAGGFYCTLEKVALRVVDLVLIPQGGALVVYHGSTPLPNTGRRVWSPMPAISA